MIATIVNCAAIIAAGMLGMLFGNLLAERVQEGLMKACGVAVIFMGIQGYLEAFSVNGNTLFVVLCLAIGTLIGSLLDIEGRFERFGDYLKKKTGSEKDGGFTDAFVTASFTVCIGAMAIIGSLEAGMQHNYTILFAKSILDFVIILVMAASLGKGALFSFIPVGIFQGSITLLSVLLKGFFTEGVLNDVSLVGSALIFCIGINLVFGKKVPVSNMLPAVFLAMAVSSFL